MKIENRKISELIPYANNAKKHDKKQVDNVAESLRQYGWVQPVVVDRDGVVVIGHCRLLAAKKLRMKEAPCVCVDDLTPEQVNALRIVDNKTNESEWDFDLLGEEIADIDLSMFDFDFGMEEREENEKEVENEEVEHINLAEKFLVPPFTILDTRQGYWIERKRKWKNLIGDKAQARINAKVTNDITFKNDSKRFEGMVSILDPVLSEIICKWFMPFKSGNKCFDVFAGDTVFGYVSSYLGNIFTGIELRKEQAEFNNQRTDGMDANYICDDGRKVLDHIKEKSQDLLFSCPPYFDLEVYSDMENDASNQKTYEEFYAIIDDAFSKAIKCLKDNRFAVIVCGEVRNKKTGFYYGFVEDIKETFRKNGMGLYNEMILVEPLGTKPLMARKPFEKYRKVCKTHQNVLVFYKGNTGEIKDHFGEIEVDYESKDMEP